VRVQSVPPGFNTERVLSMQVAATGREYRDDKRVIQFYREIEGRIARLPGVLAEGTVSALPLAGSIGWGQINVEGYTPQPGQELQVDTRIASANYFRTMEIPLIQGRFFDSHDTTTAKPAAIIDEKFARRFWPHASAVGKHIWFDDPKKAITIAGVVGVVKQEGLDAEGKIVAYFPESQQTENDMYLVARTSSADPAALANAIVREIHAVDGNVVVYQIRTMHDRLQQSLARRRFSSTMLGAFAVFALVLASVGVYGVMSYLVAQSRHDVGLRVALGARPADIVGLVVRQGMKLAAVGIAAGLAGAAVLTRLMASLLFGIRATDAPTFISVAALLAATAFLATVIPAFRATRVDPIVALREE
jgi:predicted permease